MTNAIEAEGLIKKYGDVVALDGLDLEVAQGTVMGLLGPNGAGKTTTVRILTTLLVPDAGRATVVGHDVVSDARALRRVIGLSGQNAAVDEHLTGFENLDMVGRLYHLGRTRSRGSVRTCSTSSTLASAAAISASSCTSAPGRSEILARSDRYRPATFVGGQKSA